MRRDTVKDIETLTRFYFWLVSINVIDSFSKNSFEKESHFGLYIESPFKPMYPSREAKEIEHTLPVNYIPLLLEVAISVASLLPWGFTFKSLRTKSFRGY